MKAIIWTAYGSPAVLQSQEVAKPTPKANELLIKVYAATVTAGDCEVRALKIPFLYRLPMRVYVGWRKPQRVTILGQELAGEIEAVGAAVTRFKPGDQIFAATLFRFGTYAEYACLPESHPIALKPTTMSYAEAATIPTGGVNALHFLRKAKVQAGEHVLINGAGGSIGAYGIQLAKQMGAEVTAVDSAGKLAMLTAIGADHVIDYTQIDFTQNGIQYDVIIDVVGKSSFTRSIQCLKQQGRYVLGNPSLAGMLRGQLVSARTDKKVIFEMADYKPEALHFLQEQMEAGNLKAVMDRNYPLAQTAEAHRYVETGQKAGNVVITVQE
ncbi:MAG: NAD(P)-dependent alcohol dehydrogenase [Caldilineaceae bacterium]